MDEFPQDYEVFDLGDVTLQHGATLRDAKLAYKTYGELNADKSNAIVYPTWYSGRHWDNEWLIGDGMALDPAKYFIIVPNMLGNGLSSSPSNTPPPYNAARFPHVTFYDQVEQQHRLVTSFGIETLPLVTGWSMGAGQTYQWAVSYPDMVQRALPVLRLVQDERAQRCVPRGRQVRADGGRRVQGGLVHREARQRPARCCAGVRRLGLLAGLLLAAGVQEDGLLLARGLPRRLLGGLLPRPPRPEQPADDVVDLAERQRRRDARPRVRRRPGRGAEDHQGQDDRACRRSRTSTSRPRTRSSRSATSRTPNCASFRASTATSRAAARTPTTSSSSTTSSKSSSRAEEDQPERPISNLPAT